MNGTACLSDISALISEIFNSVYKTDDEFKGVSIEKSAALLLVSTASHLAYKKADFNIDKFFAELKNSERMYYDAMNYGSEKE